jgi:hypothetical protein
VHAASQALGKCCWVKTNVWIIVVNAEKDILSLSPLKRINIFFLFAVILCVLWMFARLFELERLPDGFYIDEAAGAAHVSCIAEDLHDVNGNFAPLIVRAFKGQNYSGTHHAPFVYPAALWSKVFGNSKYSLRLFISFLNIAALGMMFIFLYIRFNSQLAICVLLSACLSPWSFHYGRLFWDPSLFPVYLIAAIVFSQLNGKRYVVLSAICFALAVYTYPPAKLAVPAFLIGCLLLWMLVERRRPSIVPLMLFLFVLILSLAPLISLEWNGVAGKRFVLVGFVHPEYIRGYGDNWFAYVGSFLDKFVLHFSPYFLFINGDGNLRHSVTGFGMLSWMDLAVLLMSLVAVGLRLMRHHKLELRPGRSEVFPFLAALLGVICFTLPAALTWEGLPHATRVIGVWPFYAFLSGYLLYALYRWQSVSAYLILCVAVVYSVVFLHHYWGGYREQSKAWFDHYQEAAFLQENIDSDWQKIMLQHRYEPEPVKYYVARLSDCKAARKLLLE